MKTDVLDIVFLHAGGRNLKGIQGPLVPIGMIGLASYLYEQDYKVKIYNLILEKIIHEDFTDEKIIKFIQAKIYCIDLHWFVHAFESIELAREIKTIHPESIIVLGGLTSSFFAKEIIKSYSFIDIIIKGEAEIPFKELLRQVKNGNSNFDDICNITYMKNGELIENEMTYTISEDLLNEINFLKFELINNWEKMFYLSNCDYNYKRESNFMLTDYYNEHSLKFWIVYTGRGCNFNCSFCGGSKNAFKRCFNRNELILRDPKRVGQDIIQLEEMGIEKIYMPHNPFIVDPAYHQQIINYIKERRSKLNCGVVFEDVPFRFDENIHEQYSDLFNTHNTEYIIYVGSINKEVSIKNHLWVDLELIEKIKVFCDKKGILMRKCFTVGMPFENYTSVLQQALYMQKHKDEAMALYTAEMHPASNVYAHPEEYGITIELNCFDDYYNLLKNQNSKSMIHGYKINTGMTIEAQYSILKSIYDNK